MFKFGFYPPEAAPDGQQQPALVSDHDSKSNLGAAGDEQHQQYHAQRIYGAAQGGAAAAAARLARTVAWQSKDKDLTLLRAVPSAAGAVADALRCPSSKTPTFGGTRRGRASMTAVEVSDVCGGTMPTGSTRLPSKSPMFERSRCRHSSMTAVDIIEPWRGPGPVSTAAAAAYSGLPVESDLVPGVYEGGLKVWEASLDLVEHLLRSNGGGGSGVFSDDDAAAASAVASQAAGRRKSALELGCGHGFPGIVALQHGLRVCFSDFNREVLEQVTIPNVWLNVEERRWPQAEYFSGDWSSLSPLLDERDGGGLFDLILTAETLYTTTVADKVLGMVLKHLAPAGQAFVASKRFYFGTGGSTQHFRDAAAATGRLVCTDAAVIDTGKGNIREVLRVTWRENGAGAEERAGAVAAKGRPPPI